jgi:glycosyltransferase involved in cell wall biosynthesis
MRPAPRVTVVVPVYNGEAHLRQALNSIVAQTFDDWEAVIVDDASGDGSGDLAAAFAHEHPTRIRLVSLTQNVGVAGARSAAVRASRGGDLVALLDQDDYWQKDYLAATVSLYDRATARGARPGIVACNAHIETADGLDGTFAERFWWLDQIDYDAMIERNYVLARALFSRAAFDEVGGFSGACLAADDYDLWLRMMEAGYEVVTTREPLVVYRIHPLAQSRNELLMHEGALAAYSRALERGHLSPHQQRRVRSRMRHFRALRERAIVRAALAERRPALAGMLALRALPHGFIAVLQDPSRWTEWMLLVTSRVRRRPRGTADERFRPPPRQT